MTRLVLILMRHGEAENPPALGRGSGRNADHARRLTPRGVAEARAAAPVFVAMGALPALVLVSDAARTRGTWAAVEAELGGGLQAEYLPRLYHGDLETYGEVAADVDAAVHPRLMIVGHNPTLSMLASLLMGAHVSFATGQGLVLGIDAESWQEGIARTGAWALLAKAP